MSCLGALVRRAVVLVIGIAAVVAAVRFAWYDRPSPTRTWICQHAPTFCEAP